LLTRALPECLTDEQLIIKCYTNNSCMVMGMYVCILRARVQWPSLLLTHTLRPL